MQNKQELRSTLSMQHHRPRTEYKVFNNAAKKQRPGAQRIIGHDKDLKTAKEKGQFVTVVYPGGRMEHGLLLDSDKYTIKLNVGEYDLTIFKHAIESFHLIVSN